MKVVSTFEEHLLNILRTILRDGSVDKVLTLLVREISRPKCLGQDCVDLVQDYLAKGIVRRLASLGWPEERFLNQSDPIDKDPVTGRLWERTNIEHRQLTFSQHTMDWLLWMTETNFAQPKVRPPKPTQKRPLTIGDRIFLLLMFDAMKSTLGINEIVRHPAVKNDGLIWLLYADEFAAVDSDKKPISFSGEFAHWFDSGSTWMLELVQRLLAQRWLEMERSKRNTRSIEELVRVSQIQRDVLSSYLENVDSAQRHDLTRFMLEAGATLFADVRPNTRWFSNLDVTHLRLADRAETYRNGLVFVNAFPTLQKWQQKAVGVTFYDEDYRASQFWKSEWERLRGDRICQIAANVMKQVDVLQSAESA